MKKVLLGALCVLIVAIAMDLVSIYTRNKPVFVLSKNNDDSVNIVYKGILYDTYNCFTESMVHIKSKWSKYSCPELKMDNNVYGVITEIKDSYIIIKGIKNTKNLKINSEAHVELSNNPKMPNNLGIGDKVMLEPVTIKEIYPIMITTNEIIVTEKSTEFKVQTNETDGNGWYDGTSS